MQLFKYWQIASGKYAIGDSHLGGLFSLDDAGPEFWNIVTSQKYKIVCTNDGFNIQDEEAVMTDFIAAMDKISPDKSHFEIQKEEPLCRRFVHLL